MGACGARTAMSKSGATPAGHWYRLVITKRFQLHAEARARDNRACAACVRRRSEVRRQWQELTGFEVDPRTKQRQLETAEAVGEHASMASTARPKGQIRADQARPGQVTADHRGKPGQTYPQFQPGPGLAVCGRASLPDPATPRRRGPRPERTVQPMPSTAARAGQQDQARRLQGTRG